MLCQYCGKRPAAFRVKEIENGRLTEYSICTECARKLGYVNLLAGFDSGFHRVLDGFFSQQDNTFDQIRCECCGSSFNDILRCGKVGCPQCYHTFQEHLLPLIQRIHGSVVHRGKIPGCALAPMPAEPPAQLSVMHDRLRQAIDTENYEQAAVLRDHIKKMEENGSND